MTGTDSGHRRLEAKLDAALARGLEQLVAELRDELLVGGHHVACPAAAPAARSRAPARCRRSARRRSPRPRGSVEVALGATQHAGDLGSPSGGGRDRVGALGEQLVERVPDRARARAARCGPARSFDVPRGQVLVGLATHDQPRVAIPAEDHRRARNAVVVVGHRVAVGAGRRSDEHVARAEDRRA